MKPNRQVMATLDKLIATAEHDGRGFPVFGQPIAVGKETIVPISAFVAAFGAGGGGFPLLSGSGGGGDLRVIPLGFLREHDGEVAFTPIALPEGLLRHGRSGTRSS